MPNYYIASRLENVDQVRWVKDKLDAAGWTHTYDWTVHGSVQKEGVERIREVAELEGEGVLWAQVVIVLLPGGRGTHTELGMAIGQLQIWNYVSHHIPVPYWRPRRIVIWSPDPDADFGTNGTTCAFYHYPSVERFDDLNKMIDSLLKGTIDP